MFGLPGHPLTSGPMVETVDQFADVIASAIELVMVLVIIIGSARTVVAIAGTLVTRQASTAALRQIWLHYAAWILLALEFALAADIIKTIVGPSWTEIGQLGAIATIRIALSYFLGRDIGEVRHEDGTEA